MPPHCTLCSRRQEQSCTLCSFILDVFMDFVSEIKARPVAEIIAAIGAPERTVYSWKMAERLPPEWVQSLVLRALKKTRPKKS